MKTSIVMILLTVLVSPFATANEAETFQIEANSAIKEFASSLKAALVSALKSGGPVEAIGVCNQEAPLIASELSKKYGMTIRRTSLKVRNPSNSADDWESAALEHFEQRKNKGEAITKLTFSEKVSNETSTQWRMMKAIPTDKVCLACHGSKIAAPVQATLDSYYPEDQATGFKLGDIRGAFSVTKTITTD